jgi:broad specificity phosphatase PhoE
VTDARPCVVLVRHGETEWSRSGQHTSRTDVPLTDAGRATAARLGGALPIREFTLVLTSPLQRARDTCSAAGFGRLASSCPDLVEWDYGDYEGRTTVDIRTERPGWTLWRDGVPGGETVEEVGARADRVIARVRAAGGDALLFSHGHFLRVLAARWVELAPADGARFALDAGAWSQVGWEREQPVLRQWNVTVPVP